MKAVIVEDELHAQQFLRALIEDNFKDIAIVACLDSVKSCIDFFSCNKVDLIFMDIQLKDGYCFKIFETVKISSSIIFTTAYDEFALKAFDQNAVAYVLKPLNKQKIESAIEKYKTMTDSAKESEKISDLLKTLNLSSTPSYKQRFVIRINSKIIVVEESNIAYFISKEHTCYLYTKDNRIYVINYTLDSLIRELNAKRFYRISRNCIVSIDSIKEISKYPAGRFKVKLLPEYKDDIITISRDMTAGFLKWVEEN
ncbi:MAG: response regulator transcription factor [Bacteroidales bacterium]|nr:response regulator transcription factor [Bacteroidales bacterium]